MTYLMHYGTKGQKWGLRKYQNPDGTLTPEGRARYGFDSAGYKFDSYHAAKRSERLYRKDMVQHLSTAKNADINTAYSNRETFSTINTARINKAKASIAPALMVAGGVALAAVGVTAYYKLGKIKATDAMKSFVGPPVAPTLTNKLKGKVASSARIAGDIGKRVGYIGATVAGTTAAASGAYKAYKRNRDINDARYRLGMY